MYSNIINVTKILDEAVLSKFHIKFIIWCALISAFEGYDLVVYGVVLPLLMHEWTLTSIQAGMLASTALVGMAVGSLFCGIVADYVGRKKVILISVLILSGATFLCTFASEPLEFGTLRFFAGLGIGGIMPNIIALTSEYSPKKMRSTLIGVMACGFAVGAIISAIVGSIYVETSGWRVKFAVAAIPVVLVPAMWKYLPESMSFLVNSKRYKEVESIINNLIPEKINHIDHKFILNQDSNVAKNSVNILFKEGRASGTILFWMAFFMCLLVVYALSSWLPKLMLNAGYPLNKSIYFLIALNLGGIIGTISGGILADKFHLKPVLISMFVIGSFALFALGFKSNAFILYTLVGVAGATIQAASILLYSYVSQFYPLVANSTGIGWASALGKFGAILGPVLTGFLLSLHLAHELNFALISIPAILAAIAISLVNKNPIAIPKKTRVLSSFE